MGAKISLLFRSPKNVAGEDLNKSEDKCESLTMDSSANVSLEISLEAENTSEVITAKNTLNKDKPSAPESHDATQEFLGEGSVVNPDRTNIESQDEINSSSQTINHKATVGSDLNSLLEMEHDSSLENMDTDMMENNVPCEINLLDLNMVTSSLQAREANQLEEKNYVPLENDMEILNYDDPLTSLLAIQDSPVGRAASSFLNKVYSPKKMKKKKKKKKKDGTVCQDEVRNGLSTSDLLHESLVKKNPDELTMVHTEFEKCNASEEVKSMGVFLTDCKREPFSLPSGCVVQDITSLSPGGHSISLQVLDNSSSDIPINGCGDEEVASMRKNMKKEVKSTINEAEFVDDSTIDDLSRDYLLQKKGEDCGDKLVKASMSLERTPVRCTRRKLLILDVNGLLVDIVRFQTHLRRPEKRVSGRSVYKRPFCHDFLKFCFDKFDVGIWSSRTRKNLLAVLKILVGDDKNRLLFCWDQSHCTITGFKTLEDRRKPLFLKELKKIWDKEEPTLPWEKGEYTPSNTLLLDDSPYKALRNPPYTAVFPRPYNFQDENDDSLGPEGDFRVYLEGLAKSDDVTSYVQGHPFGQHAITSTDPFWPFYLKVIEFDNSPAPAL